MQFSLQLRRKNANLPCRASADTRFREGNPWCWRKGQSANPRGRRRRGDDYDLQATVLDLIAQVYELQRRLRPRRDTRFERFKVLYELTGNARRSALLAGYAAKTAKSKVYLLARWAREAAGMAKRKSVARLPPEIAASALSRAGCVLCPPT